MEDPRLAGGNYTSNEERISILAKYDKVKTDNYMIVMCTVIDCVCSPVNRTTYFTQGWYTYQLELYIDPQ